MFSLPTDHSRFFPGANNPVLRLLAELHVTVIGKTVPVKTDCLVKSLRSREELFTLNQQNLPWTREKTSGDPTTLKLAAENRPRREDDISTRGEGGSLTLVLCRWLMGLLEQLVLAIS